MANQRTYTIEIKGVKESYDAVSKLSEVLDKLSDKTVKVSSEMEKESKATKNTREGMSELTKAKIKLLEYDKQYEEELQRTRSELSKQKKEVSELIKQEEAAAVVEAKQMNSYAEKQKYLTSLNKLIRTHANVTEEDKAEIAAMVVESSKLQEELKKFDEEMKIYARNVGNYPGAAQMVIDANKSMKQELKELKNEMAEMLMNGVDKTDPKFQALAKRAGELKDAMADAGDEIKHFASDTRGLDNVINLAQTATSVWGLYSNAMEAFGIENKKVEESMKSMMMVMSTLQQLQTLQNSLTAQGSATMKVYETVMGGVTKVLGLNTTATQASTAATNSLSVAQKAATAVTRTFSVVLRSIPLMLVIGLVIELVTNWKGFVNWLKNTIPWVNTIIKYLNRWGGALNTLKAAVVGVGQVIIHWLINPIKTAADVFKKVLAGDFEGAMSAAVNGIKKQFTGLGDAFMNGFQKQVDRGLEEISLKSLEEGHKVTKQELEELKIRERNNKTYSKKYIDLQKKEFEERKKLAKGNEEELNKIKLEELQFEADIEDKKTAYAKEQKKEREKAAKEAEAKAKKAAAEAKKAAEEYKKLVDDLKKKSEENIKDANELIKASIEQSKKLYKEAMDEAYKNQLERYLGSLDIKGFEEIKDKTLKYQKDTLKETEKYYIKRKEFIIQELLVEADETKKNYEKIINDTETLIANHQTMLRTATGDTRKNLQEELKQLQITLEKTTKEMKTTLGEYAEKPITIPFQFDADNLKKMFNEWEGMVKLEGRELAFDLIDVFEMIAGTGNSLIETELAKYDLSLEKNVDKLKDYFSDMAVVAMLPRESIEEINKTLDDFAERADKTSVSEEKIKEYVETIRKLFVNTNTDITKLGQIATKTLDEIKKAADDFEKEVGETMLKDVEKIFSDNEKYLKSFQEAAKGLKLEIVNVDDAFTKTFGGQIMSIDKTRERYDKLRYAYEEYLEVLEERHDEEIWAKKIEAIKLLYGEYSDEYELVLREKEKADAEYLMEFEKVQEQIRQIDKKTNDIAADYAQSLGNRIKDIYKAFNENMFEPLAEGFTALLDYQIEEAEKRLEDVEKILDKAVELREDSEQKIEEINNKLKDSDKGNTEALKQQLADEMVLLVQRQQNERDLQKQKEREEALIQKKEKQQRKIELGQKLIEGIVNTAVGVTSALRYGIPLGPIFAAIIGAMGALQTGIIIKQMSKLEKGGKIKNSGVVGEDGHGRRHSQGGHRIEGTNIEVEMGEMVVNRRSTKKYDKLLTAINEDNPVKVRTLAAKYENGGVLGRTTIINNYNNTPMVSSSIRKFANGGQLNYGGSVAAIERNSDAYRVTQAIENMDFEPVVSVVDIQKKTNSLTKVKDLAGK